MKKTIKAILLLVALAGWMFFPPPKTVASQTEIKTEQIIAPANEATSLQQSLPQTSVPSNAQQLVRRNNASRSESHLDGQKFSSRSYSKDEVQALIIQYSEQYGISADLPLRVANCESGYNQFAKNKSSSASGVYQWLSSSWRNQPASEGGTVSVFDADKNISAAVWLIAHNQISPWRASQSCWNK